MQTSKLSCTWDGSPVWAHNTADLTNLNVDYQTNMAMSDSALFGSNISLDGQSIDSYFSLTTKVDSQLSDFNYPSMLEGLDNLSPLTTEELALSHRASSFTVDPLRSSNRQSFTTTSPLIMSPPSANQLGYSPLSAGIEHNPFSFDTTLSSPATSPAASYADSQQEQHSSPATSPEPSEASPRARKGSGERIPHSLVERRYRRTLSTNLERLRQALPPASTAAGMDPNSESARKIPKAAILSAAVDHIRVLEVDRSRLASQNTRLAADVAGLRDGARELRRQLVLARIALRRAGAV